MFLAEPPPSPGLHIAYQADRDDSGYVDNLTHLWCWRPDVLAAFASTRELLTDSALTSRDRAVLVAAAAGARSDSYCSLAWGTRLAGEIGEQSAAAVLTSADDDLDDRSRALAAWARKLVTDPNATTAADVDALRQVGLNEQTIFDATALVAFRLAFSTVNDALGAQPDAQLSDAAPPGVRAVVTYGRPTAAQPSV
jgi:uncharacterized peroxidase-related enzyme